MLFHGWLENVIICFRISSYVVLEDQFETLLPSGKYDFEKSGLKPSTDGLNRNQPLIHTNGNNMLSQTENKDR
jgi:hypothetical protein